MTKVKALKATARPGAGTGAARAVRRQGRVPENWFGPQADESETASDLQEDAA